MKKKLPNLKSDTEAEAFVDTANLSKYDLSEMIPVRFKMKRKDNGVQTTCVAREGEIARPAKRSTDVYNGSNWK
jgi:hypothetical protein